MTRQKGIKKNRETRSTMQELVRAEGPEQIFQINPLRSQAMPCLAGHTVAPRLANVSPSYERQTHYRLEVESCVAFVSPFTRGRISRTFCFPCDPGDDPELSPFEPYQRVLIAIEFSQ